MSSLRVYRAASRAVTLELLRAPEFIAPTLALPVAFYVLFASMVPGADAARIDMLARFGVFATMGPALFSFGAGVATERERGWLELLRISPAPAGAHLFSRVVATWLMTAASLALMYIAAFTVSGVRLPINVWAGLTVVHLLSALPFVFIGLSLGFMLSSRGAIAAANLALFGLAVVGGLWFPVRMLPSWLAQLAQLTPSYHLSEAARLLVSGSSTGLHDGLHEGLLHGAAACALTLVCAGVALLAWRRQS
ncbi:MAG: ABC transporter permease [Myxococcota bacterium]